MLTAQAINDDIAVLASSHQSHTISYNIYGYCGAQVLRRRMALLLSALTLRFVHALFLLSYHFYHTGFRWEPRNCGNCHAYLMNIHVHVVLYLCGSLCVG